MKDLFTHPTRARFLLAKCIIASLALHSAALYIWINHPILLSNCNSLFSISMQPAIKQSLSGENISLDSAVEDFFESFFLASNNSSSKSDLLATPVVPSSLLQKVKLEETDNDPTIPLCKTYILQETLPKAPSHNQIPLDLKEEPLLPLMAFNFTPKAAKPPAVQQEATSYKLPDFTYENSFLNEEFLCLKEQKSPMQELPIKNTTSDSFLAKESFILQESLPSTPSQGSNNLLEVEEAPLLSLSKNSSSFSNTTNPQNLIANAQLAEVDNYLPTQVLYSMQWNDNFTLTPSFFADGEGYVFSLALASNDTVQAERVKQNFYFLIDVSSGVESHKIAVFKRSALKALSSLQSGDSFNIILLDKKITRLSPHNLPFSFQNLQKAEAFLAKKNDRAVFSSFDLFQGLDKTLDFIESNEEVHTAILLTNGKISGSLSHNRKALLQFLNKNKGKMTLFAGAVGKNNDLVYLDMISSLAGGKLLYSDTNASLPRKLNVFMKTLQSPLAKDVQLSIHTNDPKADIVLLPRASQSAHLYNKEPFLVMGKISRLADLKVALEGKNEGGWVLVSKEVDFATAEESSLQIQKEWALRQASLLYEKFLEDPKASYLQEAKEILKMTHGRALGE